MDHSELVQEMVLLEKMTAQERLKHARRRRQQQLKSWLQRENASVSNGTTARKAIKSPAQKKKASVKFPENVVLLEAAARQDVEEVRQLLQSGKYRPNTSNEDGLTPIHQCSIDNSDKLLKLLIEYGGDVNAKDRDLWTPLHAAATCGHLQICRTLIESGAELLALNADGNMPYDICDDEATLDYIEIQMDRVGITQDMIDETRGLIENQMLNDLQNLVKKRSPTAVRSIDDVLSYRNQEGVTPLHIASANGYQTIVDYLLRQHVSINLQDSDGWTPIHAAAFWCQQAILGQLIEAGADIHEKIPDGRSALELCDDPDLRTYMINFRDQTVRNQEKAAAAAAAVAAQSQQKTTNRLQVTTNSLPNGTTSRTGTLYESRSSVSSPYGSGSSLNRTSSIRRASIRDREKVKKLNEHFLDVLQAKDDIQEDAEEGAATNVLNSNSTLVSSPSKQPSNREEQTSSITGASDSTVRESLVSPPSTSSTKKTQAPVIDITLPPLKAPPPPPVTQMTADTLSDVKRRREERRRVTGLPLPNGTLTSTSLSPPLDTSTTNQKHNASTAKTVSNGVHKPTVDEPAPRYASPKHNDMNGFRAFDADREKRICCAIL